MKKTTAFLLCGTAALMTLNVAAQAAPAEPNTSNAPSAQSYAELLAPIPDALATLRAEVAAQARQAQLQLAQYHHHHHHNHHHHHHHHGYFGFGFGGGPFVAPYYDRGDCHWVWGRGYWHHHHWVRRRVWVCD